MKTISVYQTNPQIEGLIQHILNSLIQKMQLQEEINISVSRDPGKIIETIREGAELVITEVSSERGLTIATATQIQGGITIALGVPPHKREIIQTTILKHIKEPLHPAGMRVLEITLRDSICTIVDPSFKKKIRLEELATA